MTEKQYEENYIEFIEKNEFPIHWYKIPLKHLFTFEKGLTITKEDLRPEGSKVISYGQIHSKSNSGTAVTNDLIRFVDDDYLASDAKSIIPQNGFVFADTSEDLEGCGNAVLNNTDELIFGGYHTIVLKPKSKENSKFLAYLFKTDLWRCQIRTKLTAVKVYSVSQKVLKSTYVVLPPLSEQQQIADFLDSKTASIDSAIQAQKDIIEKLKEYRQAVITEAVTKGLNRDAEIGKSGFPKCWYKIPLKYLFSFDKGLSITKEDLRIKGSKVISYGQIHSKSNLGTTVTNDLIRFVDNDYLITDAKSIIPQNGFVFADTSEDLEGCGNAVFNDTNELIFGGYHTIVLKPKSKENSKFLAYLFKTDLWRYQIRTKLTAVKVYSVSQKVLKSTYVVLPPKEEELKIVEYLDSKTTTIDKAIEQKNAIIEKLEEYKKSIIYNAVTGKIDCRKDVIPE